MMEASSLVTGWSSGNTNWDRELAMVVRGAVLGSNLGRVCLVVGMCLVGGMCLVVGMCL